MSDLPCWGAVLIVKNEETTIERCLTTAAAAGVAVVTLLDTGSTDATLPLAQAVAERTGLDLRVHHTTFVDFGQARSEAFTLAHGTARWIVALDADMALKIDEGFEPHADLDCLMIEMGNGTAFSYRLPLVLNGAIKFVSIGAVHEFTQRADGVPYLSTPTDQVRVDMGGVYRGSPEKYLWHAGMLERSLAEDPDNARTVFYLGQTYASLGRTDDARAMFRRRAGMGGFAEEAYYAAYRAATLAPWPDQTTELMAAWEMRPSRLEALHDLVRGLNERGMHRAAYALASLPTAPCGDVLFVSRDVWDWGMKLERSIAAWWVGERAESLALCDELLANPRLPDHIRALVVKNRAFAA